MNKKQIKIELPIEVKFIIDTLYNNGYEAYIVGGCVRDSLLNKEPNDWDITTNANPVDIKKIFIKTGYKVLDTGIKHGTVTLLIHSIGYEITTFRIDGEYDDNRHPKEVKFVNDLKKDVSRRDFTINAMAYNDKVGLIDYFNGFEDLECKKIKCVGVAKDRFEEDALRMLRAIRFTSQLDFMPTDDTFRSIIRLHKNINQISKERIREELCKILTSNAPSFGIRMLYISNLLKDIIPELNDCVGFQQFNKHHDKDVFNHILSVVENTPNKLELRLSALLHDIGKPKCFTIDNKWQGHFYGHQKISADMSRNILKRLKFDNKTIDKVCLLVYEHMSRCDKLRDSNIKKFINKIGINNLNDLFELQIADIKGCSKKHCNFDNVLDLKFKCEKILMEKQPLMIADLNLNGDDIIKLGVPQGKKIGLILNQLLEIVLENPILNNKEYLIKYIQQNYI